MLPCLAAFSQDDDDVITLRIMTYNIRHGEGMDDVIDLDRQAAIISNAAPDVVGLQEVDSVVKRSGYINQAAYLATATGMYGTFGPAIPLTKGKYGVAILSKEAPISVRNIPLPGKEKRTLLVCEFQEYVFATTHLDLDDECRLNSVPIIIEEASRWDKPFFICGDWNDQPSSTLITKLKKSFTFINNITNSASSYTFPANSPNRIIDYIASYGRIVKSLKSRKVLNEPTASDHRPILVEIMIEQYTTGIRQPSSDGDALEEDGLYDLSGRKWQVTDGKPALLPKGIYIQNRRKILIK